jgi:hypothetical protein
MRLKIIKSGMKISYFLYHSYEMRFENCIGQFFKVRVVMFDHSVTSYG